jgi:hypothetical protein
MHISAVVIPLTFQTGGKDRGVQSARRSFPRKTNEAFAGG